jgi:hypothetical protein
VRWIVVSYRLPSGASTARVAVWREARRIGALPLQRSVVVVPDTPAYRAHADGLRAVVAEQGGESVALEGDALTPDDATRLVGEWNAAREGEYVELADECGKLVAEIAHEFAIEKFTLAELEEEESELDKLERWRARIAERDVLDAPSAARADEALGAARAEVERFAAAVFDRSRSA